MLNSNTFAYVGSGRETFLVRVHWVDDWPVFNYGQKISLKTRYSSKENDDDEHVQEFDSFLWEEKLLGAKLGIGWYQKSEMTLLLSFV